MKRQMLVGILTGITLVACRTGASGVSSNVAASGSQASESRGLGADNALITKLKSLSTEDEKIIDSAKFSDLLAQFEKVIAYNAEKSPDPKWREIQSKLVDSQKTLKIITQKYPTVGDLRKAAGAQNYKSLNVAPWQSDLDAFPMDAMYPAPSNIKGRALLVIDPITARCIGSAALGAAGFWVGIIGELGTNAGGFTHNPADRNVFAWLGAGMVKAAVAGFMAGGC
jgi:hypothetical protein